VAEIIRIFDNRLSQTPYLAGDAFSVADITAMIATDFMKPARLTLPDEALHFKRWYAQVCSRPSHKA